MVVVKAMARTREKQDRSDHMKGLDAKVRQTVVSNN